VQFIGNFESGSQHERALSLEAVFVAAVEVKVPVAQILITHRSRWIGCGRAGTRTFIARQNSGWNQKQQNNAYQSAKSAFVYILHKVSTRQNIRKAKMVTSRFLSLTTNQVFLSRCVYPDSCLLLLIQERQALRQVSLSWPVG